MLDDRVEVGGLRRLLLPQNDVHVCRPVCRLIIQLRLVALIVLKASFDIFSDSDTSRVDLISVVETVSRSETIFGCRVEVPV